jgi:hypothetical protein
MVGKKEEAKAEEEAKAKVKAEEEEKAKEEEGSGKLEDRRQRTEDRRPKTEDGRPVSRPRSSVLHQPPPQSPPHAEEKCIFATQFSGNFGTFPSRSPQRWRKRTRPTRNPRP